MVSIVPGISGGRPEINLVSQVWLVESKLGLSLGIFLSSIVISNELDSDILVSVLEVCWELLSFNMGLLAGNLDIVEVVLSSLLPHKVSVRGGSISLSFVDGLHLMLHTIAVLVSCREIGGEWVFGMNPVQNEEIV